MNSDGPTATPEATGALTRFMKMRRRESRNPGGSLNPDLAATLALADGWKVSARRSSPVSRTTTIATN